MKWSRRHDPTQEWEFVPFLGADIYLPPEQGVYVVCSFEDDSFEEFIYVGRSHNLRKRWREGHHQALPCCRYNATHIRYFLTDKTSELELKLIYHYEPPLNARMNATNGTLFKFDPDEWSNPQISD